MKIQVSDKDVILQSEDGSLLYPLLTRPDIGDYGNLTLRPLVTSYHLVKETIWERFCKCMQNLESLCPKDPYLACYAMTFGVLYPFLLAGSQAKNILHYGFRETETFLPILRDFMNFLQPDSSLAALPPNPFIFSGLADGSWHAAVVNLDAVREPETICDAISKIRKNGMLLLYTASQAAPDLPPPFLQQMEQTAFGTSILYRFPVDDTLQALVCPHTAAAGVLNKSELFSAFMQDLTSLLQHTESDPLVHEDCLRATRLLGQMETLLYSVYNYLENPTLPVYASLLKEAVTDYCSRLDSPTDIPACADRLQQAARLFLEAAEAEF